MKMNGSLPSLKKSISFTLIELFVVTSQLCRDFFKRFICTDMYGYVRKHTESAAHKNTPHHTCKASASCSNAALHTAEHDLSSKSIPLFLKEKGGAGERENFFSRPLGGLRKNLRLHFVGRKGKPQCAPVGWIWQLSDKVRLHPVDAVRVKVGFCDEYGAGVYWKMPADLVPPTPAPSEAKGEFFRNPPSGREKKFSLSPAPPFSFKKSGILC